MVNEGCEEPVRDKKKLKDLAKLHSDKSVVAKDAGHKSDDERAGMFREMWREQRDSLSIK